MLRVLIADDEEKEVLFLKHALPWADMGLEIIGVASNGLIADQMEMDLCPDILITDILMPHVSGVELAERARKRHPELHIIFLSGHRNFEYARAGIHSEVDSYLLKPVDTAQLHETVKRIAERCIQAKTKQFEQQLFQDILQKNMPVLRETMLRQLLDGLPESDVARLKFYDLNFQQGDFCVAVLQVELDLQQYGEYERNLENYRVNLAISEIVSAHERVYYCASETPGQWVLFFNQPHIHLVAAQILAEVQRNIRLMCQFHAAAGVGKIVNSIRDIPTSYHTALIVLEQQFTVDAEAMLFFDDIAGNDEKMTNQITFPVHCLKESKHQLSKAVLSGQRERIHDILDELEEQMRPAAINVQMMHMACIEVINETCWQVSIYDPAAMHAAFPKDVSLLPLMQLTEFADMRRWVEDVCSSICKAIHANQKSRQLVLVEHMKQYIEDNLDKDMTVESIADAVSVSRGYASSIFKRQIGMGISQYLLSVRMRMAKELLEHSTLQIREIASKVGFYNHAHFSAVFKREIGITPREYRASLDTK